MAERALAFNTNRWALTPGGWGLTSTLDDYMRFARMLQNEGELEGVRILRAETVRLMATSHLPDSITDRMWLPSKGQVGFGVDVAVRTVEHDLPLLEPGLLYEWTTRYRRRHATHRRGC